MYIYIYIYILWEGSSPGQETELLASKPAAQGAREVPPAETAARRSEPACTPPVYIYIYIYTYIHVLIYSYVYCTYLYIYIYIYIYTYI